MNVTGVVMNDDYRMCSIWTSSSQGRSTFFSVFLVVLFFSIVMLLVAESGERCVVVRRGVPGHGQDAGFKTLLVAVRRVHVRQLRM